MTSSKENILALSKDVLAQQLKDCGLKPFIAKQLFNWIYQKHKFSFDDMANISKANQDILKKHFTLSPFTHVESVSSDAGKAIKLICTLEDGFKIECVVLKEKTYNTLCVSSQCGCPVDCKFCLTGKMGFKRHLAPHEIVAQILLANSMGHTISNLVFMGMGEPMLNYDNVFAAIDHMTAEDTFNISKRKITVSTSGYLANIKRLIKDERYINLAFSVGHANPLKRIALMPIEKRNPITEVAKVIHQYQQLHNRKLTLEYTLIDGKNEDEQAIKELGNLAMYLNAKVNLINLNPHPKIPFKPVSTKVLHRAQDQLKKRNIPVTVRFKKGDDIAAACGQLGESTLYAKGGK